MCGRYVSPAQAEIEREWSLPPGGGDPFETRYNVAPQQGNPRNYIPVVRQAAGGAVELARMQWWLLRHVLEFCEVLLEALAVGAVRIGKHCNGTCDRAAHLLDGEVEREGLEFTVDSCSSLASDRFFPVFESSKLPCRTKSALASV
jgi:hypothetical protein